MTTMMMTDTTMTEIVIMIIIVIMMTTTIIMVITTGPFSNSNVRGSRRRELRGRSARFSRGTCAQR